MLKKELNKIVNVWLTCSLYKNSFSILKIKSTLFFSI